MVSLDEINAVGVYDAIKTVRLDDYFKDTSMNTPDFMLLDVEGYELFALRGAERVLKNISTMIIEVNPRVQGRSAEGGDKLIQFLLIHGYTLQIINDGNYPMNIFLNYKDMELIPYEDNFYKNFHADFINVLAKKKI